MKNNLCYEIIGLLRLVWLGCGNINELFFELKMDLMIGICWYFKIKVVGGWWGNYQEEAGDYKLEFYKYMYNKGNPIYYQNSRNLI